MPSAGGSNPLGAARCIAPDRCDVVEGNILKALGQSDWFAELDIHVIARAAHVFNKTLRARVAEGLAVGRSCKLPGNLIRE